MKDALDKVQIPYILPNKKKYKSWLILFVLKPYHEKTVSLS